MNLINTSICIECGKQRIVISTRTEKIGSSIITYKETGCADPVCQAKVDKLLALELAKRTQSMSIQRHKIIRRKSITLGKRKIV